jgi:RNA polymerase sigma-70 factor (ECF subfamily)
MIRAVEANGIEYIDGLYGYAMILTRIHEEAEDLVNETYFRAIPAMKKLGPKFTNKVWIFTILRNVWLNNVQEPRTGSPISDNDAEEGVPGCTIRSIKNPQNIIASRVEVDQFRAAIERLSLELREIILLREYEDLSYREIAHVLDCPIGTVMSRLARARSTLRLLLSATYSELKLK